jgi:hypothetical protein
MSTCSAKRRASGVEASNCFLADLYARLFEEAL